MATEKDKKYIQSRGTGMARAMQAGKASKERVEARNKPKPVTSADTQRRRGDLAGAKALYGSMDPKATDTGQQDDFMSLLESLMGGSGGGGGGGRGPAYSAGQIADAQNQFGANRAKMEALYKRYAEDIAAREADVAANYSTAATNLGSIYDTATGNVSKAYDSARAAQNQQLLALGMTEQTPVQSFGNQTGATTSFENLRAAVLAQNEASRKAAITNQKLAAEGATREGVDKLSAYDAQVAKAIAEMQNATVSYGGGGGGSSSGLSPNQYASLALQKMKMDQDAQIAAANLAAKTAPKATPNLQAAFNSVANTTYTPEQLKAVELQMRYGG